ncbi:hypothetical protein ASPVEDRAFT_55591 [Aspergillus versicolor CBS 583.65]|uniref:Dimethylallyltranstransferase n=1 Tax=Aspergillus versicolor CBS 583.65 TaxID=1036611 RepID=A0A1L9PWH8_ASPVE|nr:uncharacterized protein ASPVEDRAFT_55591 [Aspergillus versicolor CBS 583.65]OJJ05786.1 hypothetical protein ASPVEDRAFT_55591 [Aspergillus versicolor CBS 583.65]
MSIDAITATATILQSRPPTPSQLHVGKDDLVNETAYPDPKRFQTIDLDFTARGTWVQAKEKAVLGPYDYIASRPGKQFRTMLLEAFNVWLDVPCASMEVINNVIRMLHTSSLLIDDIQDNSVLRRGQPVAHSVFGIAQTINAANYVYFHALRELQKLNNRAAAVDIFTEELLSLHQGQGMDLLWRDTLTCPSEEDYLEMIANKTGGLFRLAIKLMQAESAARVDCLPLVQILGVIFQIADDYRNLTDVDYTATKGFCEDLTEGKFSFPVIHSILADTANTQLLHILAGKPTSVDIKRCAVDYIRSTGSFEYTEQVVGLLMERARAAVDAIDQACGTKNKGIYALLDRLALKRRFKSHEL